MLQHTLWLPKNQAYTCSGGRRKVVGVVRFMHV